MKKLFIFGTFVCLVAFSACNDDESSLGSGTNTNSDLIVEKEFAATTFTINVVSTFQGLSEDDILYGEKGVLYCEKDKDAESYFTRWQEQDKTVLKQSLKKMSTNTLEKGGTMNLIVKGLKPGTEYYVCSYFVSEDEQRRKMGKIQTVKTKDFLTVVDNLGVVDTSFFSINTASAVTNLDSLDGAYCTLGLQFSKVGEDLSDVQKIKDIRSKTYNIKVASLTANTSYQFRPYLYVQPLDSIIYGDTKTVNTRNYDEAAVDMGTSVLWSKYFLGSESEDESGDPYRFGQTEPTGIGLGGKYALVDEDGYFNEDCPNNISGTDLDAATKRLGKGWRIPTTAEVQELLSKVTITAVGAKDRYKTKLKLRSANGATITLPQTDYCYAYTRKVIRYDEVGYAYFFAADMTESEPYETTYYRYNMSSADFNELLDQLLDEYLEEHPDATTIYLRELLDPLVEQGIVWYETVTVTNKGYTLYRTNYPMYYIDAVGVYDGPTSMVDGWGFTSLIRTYADYGYCILPVRDRE